MSARHPVKLDPDSTSDYCDPAECSIIRIFWEEPGWAVDAAKLDEDGNVVGFTERCWSADSWEEIIKLAPEFVADVVPHLLPTTRAFVRRQPGH